jgi:hypothetical protein
MLTIRHCIYLDKNIVLGPPKTNFNSSVFGGLKHSEDATQGGKSGSSYSSNRPRQVQHTSALFHMPLYQNQL